MKNTAVEIEPSTDALGWVIASVFSLAAFQLRDVMALDGITRQLVCLGALFLTGLVAGAFRPRRAWRWALAGFVTFALSDFVHLGSDPHFPELDLHDILFHLTKGAPVWALHAFPILAGAYVGASLPREGLE